MKIYEISPEHLALESIPEKISAMSPKLQVCASTEEKALSIADDFFRVWFAYYGGTPIAKSNLLSKEENDAISKRT